MTPLREGRLHRLDDSTEALYLFGVADRADADRTPGWYLRRRMAGEAATIEAGPFASLEEASRAHLGPPTFTHPVGPTPEEILAEAAQYVRTLFARAQTAAPGEEYTFAAPDAGDGGWHVLAPSDRTGRLAAWTGVNIIVTGARYLVWVGHGPRRCRVDDYVKLEAGEGLVLGPHVHIASFCHLGIGGGTTILEEGASCGSGAKIISGSNTYGADHGCSAIAPDATVSRSFAWVKKNATLYVNAVMLPGSVLGEGSVLAAGAVLTANTTVPPHQLWGGVPARFIKEIR